MTDVSLKDVVLRAADQLDELMKSHYELRGQLSQLSPQVADHEVRLRHLDGIPAEVAKAQTIQTDHESRLRRLERFRYSVPKLAGVLAAISTVGTLVMTVLYATHFG